MENWFDPQAMGSSPTIYSPIGGLGDAIVAARERRRKREEADRRFALDQQKMLSDTALEKRKADLYGRQIDASIQNQGRQERRDQLKFDVEEAKRRGEVGKGIAKALGGGRTGEAQMLANSSQFAGPNGTMQGVQLSQEPNALPKPTAPQEPQAPEFVGPLETPEDARSRAIFDGLRPRGPQPTGTEPPPFVPGQPEPGPTEEQGASALAAGDNAAAKVEMEQAARDQYGADRAALPGKQAEYDKANAAYQDAEKNPKFRATYPGGQSDVIDPREAQAAADAEARDQASRLRQAAATPGTPPDVQRSMMLQADLIQSGIKNADKAPVTNMNSAVQSQGFKAVESAKDREVKREAIRARAIHKGLGGGHGKEWQKEETGLAGQLKTWGRDANLVGPKGLGENQRALSEAYSMASQEDQNPANQIIILDKLLRSASGLGVRQQMLQAYRDHLGGLIARGQGQAEQWLTGREGAEQWANVKGAIHDQLANSQAAGGEENAKFHRAYDNSEAAKRHPDLLKRYEAEYFSGLHGYGQKADLAEQKAPGTAPQGGTKKLVDPKTGAVMEFDSSGKRVK